MKHKDCQMSWGPNDVDVSFLQYQFKVTKHQEEWVPLGRVQLEESILANTREAGLYDSDRVAHMAAAAREGQVYPYTVHAQTAAGGHVILGGVHRYKIAELLGDTHVRAVVIPPVDNDTATLIRVALNSRNGVREKTEYYVRSLAALHLRDPKKFTLVQLRKLAGCSQVTLSRVVSALKVRRDVEPHDVLLDLVPDYVVACLHPLPTAGRVALGRVFVTALSPIKEDTARHYAQRVQQCIDAMDNAALEATVKSISEELSPQTGLPGVKATEANRLLRTMRTLCAGLRKYDTLIGFGFTKDQLATYQTLRTQIIARFEALQ